MKRSLFSLLLVLALLVAVSAFAVEANTTAPIPYEEAIDNGDGTLTFACPACNNTNQKWTPVALNDGGTKLGQTTGHVYVPESYTLEGTPFTTTAFSNIGGKLCLYLAGDMKYTGSGRMFQLYNSATTGNVNCVLNILGTGTIMCEKTWTGDYGLITASTNTTGGFNEFAMWGGTIDCSKTKAPSGVVYLGKNTSKTGRTDKFTMHGGTIYGGTATGGSSINNYGGAVNLRYGGEFTMDGGTIYGGTATKGGAVAIEVGTIDMSGGTITGGTSTDVGGNLWLFKGEFDISGGTIEHGTGSLGGNIYVYGSDTDTLKGVLTLGSNATVAAGSANSTGGNIMIYQYGTLNLNGGTVTTADVDPGDGDGDAAGTVGDAAPNIGVSHATGDRETSNITFVKLNSGTIAGGAGYEGGAVWFNQSRFGDKNRASLTLGDVTIHEEGRLSDIYNYLRALVTVDDSFTDKVVISTSYGAPTTNDKVNDDISLPILKRSYVTHSGYQTAGEVIFRYNDEDHELLGWTNGSNKNMSYGDAVLSNGAAVIGVGYVQDLVDAYDGTGYIKLCQPSAITLTKPTTVDFDGHDATVTGAANLLGMDEATNDYKQDGAAVVTTDVAPAFNHVVELTIPDKGTGTRKYLALPNDDGTYSFHRYYIAQRNIGIRVNKDDACPDLIFSGTFRGDEAIAANVESFGINFQDTEGNNKMIDYVSCGQTFTPTNPIYGRNINITITEAQAKEWGEKMFRGIPYIKITGSDELLTPTNISAPTSAKEQVAYFCNNYATLTESQQTLVDAMIEKSKALFDECGWNYSKAV